jgi:TolB-like protein/Flp pilus assembly protein TadD
MNSNPPITGEQWRRVRSIVAGALEVAEEHVPHYLDRVIVGDQDLRHRAEELLRACRVAEVSLSFLDSPVGEFVGPLLDPADGGAFTPEFPAGSTIGTYAVERQLGSGGMGVVYLARDPVLDRRVAIKVLPPRLASAGAAKRRLAHEAKAASALEHPNLGVVYGFGEMPDGRPYMAMAYYEGETLGDRIGRGPLDLATCTELALQIASALAVAHERGIVHRDIKPGNVIVTDSGLAKVVDFGASKLADDGLMVERRIGTVAYMSPEQTRGDSVDARTDVWSLGVVLYEMLTGTRPFRGVDDRALIHAIRHEVPRSPREGRPELDARFERLVLCCLEKDPQDRYPNAGALHADLVALGPSPSVGLAEAVEERAWGGLPSPHRLRKPAWALMAAAVLAVGGWTITNTWLGGDSPEIRRLAVLPLANITGNPEQDYFVAGMHDALVTELGRVADLTVISRQSVLQYARSDKPLPVIARELGVDALVEGSVFLAGDSVRVSAQLIRADPEERVWSEAYRGNLAEALALQGEVARGIARAVDATETPEERARPASVHAVKPEAQEAYLRGLYHLEQGVLGTGPAGGPLRPWERSFQTAIDYLEEAVALDPEWAAAHAKLALAYHWAGQEFHPNSKAAALRALELDETEAQAHASLGYVLYAHEWDWAGAERAIRRALELEDSDWSHWIYANYLRAVERYDEAITHFRLGEERRPLSAWLKSQLGLTYFCAGRYDEAIDLVEHTFQLWPDDAGNGARMVLLADAYSAKSMHAEAIAEFEKVIALDDSAVGAVAGLAYAYARAGRHDEARALLPWLERRGWSWQIPLLYVVLDQTDDAVAMVQAAFRDPQRSRLSRVYVVGLLRCYPEWEVLKADPRIRDIMRQIDLPA